MKSTELRVTVVDAALHRTTGMWGDCRESWQPSGAAWVGRLSALGVPYDVGVDASSVDSGLVIDPTGCLTDACTDRVLVGEPPASGEETLRVLAEHLGALVVPDLRGVLVLRLDDPGAAVKEHLQWWRHPPVGPDGWNALWTALEGFGRVSLFCCPGYVRGDGTVVDSRRHLPGEWAAMDDGVTRGVADLECHGFTHMHPDTDAWATADDRLADASWFRELWPTHCVEEPDVDAQAERLQQWQSAIGSAGTTLVAPGEQWGLNTLAAAQRCGLRLLNSWGICFLDRTVPTWSSGIGSPYLDEPDAALFDDCLPQIGYWHDRDMAVHGPSWVPAQLARWRDCGAERALAFADLVRAYEPIDAVLQRDEVVVRSGPDVPLRVIRP